VAVTDCGAGNANCSRARPKAVLGEVQEGVAPPAVEVRGYNLRKIFAILHAKSYILMQFGV
jgi:hypothetical protein